MFKKILLINVLLLCSCLPLQRVGIVGDTPEETATNIVEVTEIGTEAYVGGGLLAGLLAVGLHLAQKHDRRKFHNISHT